MEIDNLVVKMKIDGSEEFVKKSKDSTDSLEKAEEQANKYTKSLKNMSNAGISAASSLSRSLLALGGISLGVGGMFRLFNNLGNSYIKMGTDAKYLGLTERQIDGLTRASRALGASGTDITSTIAKLRHLSDTMRDPSLSMGGIDKSYLVAVQKLSSMSGVDIDVKGGDVLNTYRQVIEAISKLRTGTQQRLAAESLGISPAILASIQAGTAGRTIDQFTAGSMQTEKAYQLALKFNQEKNKMFESASNLGMEAFIKAEPTIEKVTHQFAGFVDTLAKNPDAINDMLSPALATLKEMGKVLGVLASTINFLTNKGMFFVNDPNSWKGFDLYSDRQEAEKRAKELKSKLPMMPETKAVQSAYQSGALFGFGGDMGVYPPTSVMQSTVNNKVSHSTSSTNIQKLEVHTNSNNVDGIMNDARRKAMSLTHSTIGG